MNHTLKIKSEYFSAVVEGLKKFELRKNDRNYQVGDTIQFFEVDDYGVDTGDSTIHPKTILYIFHGGKYGLDEGYCILGF
jgi:ParB family chromosome partitioning protein